MKKKILKLKRRRFIEGKNSEAFPGYFDENENFLRPVQGHLGTFEGRKIISEAILEPFDSQTKILKLKRRRFMKEKKF